MKSITPLLLLLLTQLAVTAQVSKAYYGAASCYIDLDRTQPLVYKMGYTIDKAGSGPVTIDTDTLQTLADGTLKGRFTTIIRENGEYYLLDGRKQKKGDCT
ncbi:hypothetical protein MKQ68_07455 [Chitinophaga horti]|uniref:Uncharacterized protein n=1 Tax=Chitinophaga horti TaxID=2920382 RepID=A0ABY6J5I5_9BACT|nr:hypothetical protein [Chitinophaga horti]UYQ94928.1 hypothetical protein MKQ68_07455 [Chitinophaga horti]